MRNVSYSCDECGKKIVFGETEHLFITQNYPEGFGWEKAYPIADFCSYECFKKYEKRDYEHNPKNKLSFLGRIIELLGLGYEID